MWQRGTTDKGIRRTRKPVTDRLDFSKILPIFVLCFIGKKMTMVFKLPGKERSRVMKISGCKRLLDGFIGVLKKHPDAQFVSFNGYQVKNKA